MSFVHVSDRRERSSSTSTAEDRDLFVGATIPSDILQCIKKLAVMQKDQFRTILKALVAILEGEEIDVSSMLSLQTETFTIDDIHVISTGILTLLQSALRLPQTTLKQQVFQEDLIQMRVPEQYIADLTSVVFGNRRPTIEKKIMENRPCYPTLEQMKWRVDVAISTSALSRALQPMILMEMKSTDGKVTKFEVPVSKFSHLRYNVAYVLKEMEQLEKRSVLQIQD